MFLIICLAILVVGGMFYISMLEDSRILMLLKDEELENTRLLEKIVSLKSDALNSFANETAYWDDMVRFTETSDTAWAVANVDCSFETSTAYQLRP